MRTACMAALLAGCGSSYTIVDRSSLVVSANARTTAKALGGHAVERPELAEHLALAEEVYERQMALLKERRNKVRARRRGLGFASFGVLGAGGLAAGTAALGGAGSSHAHDALVGAGVTAVAGVALGAILQIASLAQEDYGDVDDKLRHLESLHENLLARVRAAQKDDPSDVGIIVETFIHEALSIHVKG
jgi:hypothetical protein